jgi:hypothetical protein
VKAFRRLAAFGDAKDATDRSAESLALRQPLEGEPFRRAE